MSSHPFTRAYFEGEGYAFYFDFPCHWKTVEVILKRKPESVLDVGGGRGYVVKKLEDAGVRAVCMDISEHCWHARATDSFVLWDATKTPWPFKDKEFDLCVSIAFFEHIPEDKVDVVIREMARVSRRGLHAISFDFPPTDIDRTHVTKKPREWWERKFKEVAPDWPVEILDKEEVEAGPIPIPQGFWTKQTYIVLPSQLIEGFRRKPNLATSEVCLTQPPHPHRLPCSLSRGNEKAEAGKLFKPIYSETAVYGDGLVKLNIGCFINCFHYGWVNIDILDLHEFARKYGYVFRQLDVRSGLPYPDDSVDIILASHFLEHLTREEGEKFLRECFRVLKPGGVIRLAVPDAKLLAQKYLKGEIMEYRHVNVGVENARDPAEALLHLLIAGHQTIYDEESLKGLLEKIGFVRVERMEFNRSRSEAIRKQTFDMYPTLSLYVEAEKPRRVVTARRGKLKIGLVSTPFLRTPPDTYGGLERVVADLAEELAKLGHDVTVFAADGSKVPGCRVVEFGPPALRTNVNWLEMERRAYEVYKPYLSEFQIIHNHSWFGFPYLAKMEKPELKIIHTHHGGLGWRTKPPGIDKVNLVAISKWMQRVYASQGWNSKVVYHGINLDLYRFKAEKGDRLVFVGRLDRFKQPHVAIEVAERTGLGLDIVGGSFVQDPAYLEEVKRMCDGEKIRLHLDAPDDVKVRLLQNAKALLFPSKMGGEPFGLVAVEAMACVPYETQVVSPPILAVHSRKYEGELVQVETERGLRLTLTPNHEVLTNRGWLPAGYLNIGDTVYCLDANEEREVQPTRIGNIVEGTTEKVREGNSGNPWEKHNKCAYKNTEARTAEDKRAGHKISRIYANGDGACLSGWNNRWGRLDNDKEISQKQQRSTIGSIHTNSEFVRRATRVVEGKTFSSKRLCAQISKSWLTELPIPDKGLNKRLSPADQASSVLGDKKITRNGFAKVHRGTNGCWSKDGDVSTPIGVPRMHKMVEPETIEKVRTYASSITVYNLTTITGYYFANGILVHNCGTPVVALRDGAIPEVVEDGVTGYVCDSVEEMVKAVEKVGEIEPKACRERVERFFSREIMAGNYLRLYLDVLEGREW